MKNNIVCTLNDGTLSQYGLFCGYVDRDENNNLSVELYHDCGVFALRVFVKPNNDDVVCSAWNDLNNDTFRSWLTFENSDYSFAKKIYKKLRSLVYKNKQTMIKDFLVNYHNLNDKNFLKALETTNGYKYYLNDNAFVYFQSQRGDQWAQIKIKKEDVLNNDHRLLMMKNDLTN